MKIKLFADVVPKMTKNCRQFYTGEFRRVPCLECVSTCHRVIMGFMIQSGDFVNGDGTRVASIYWGGGGAFAGESFKLRHSAQLQAYFSGPSTNGRQFFITCSKCDWLDGEHVAFGEKNNH
ncbi:unnamed protein product [Nyctereutes procyonoides]|uniref:Peptidyl-prolyl cis-trans isomerase n=1 Tax=Nyctereutes procyonoides TaxID=34880 RepID=A0A811YS07_NYCPR|nr:unnamed protein product [Nyctereutes procyonoides]